MERTKGNIIISLGLVISSIIFSYAFFYSHAVAEKHISVKGLSERELDANVGIWSIKFEATDNSLNEVNAQVQKQTKTVVSFLKEKGFGIEDITYGVPRLNDNGRYSSREGAFRYVLNMKVVLHSQNIFLVYEAAQKSQDLINMGVQLTNWRGPLFIFTNLNEVKPSMIQEATINAKKAAEQLASDANVTLGALRSATQGTFSIKDTHIPTKKQVRVVTCMDYSIKE